MSRNYQSQQSQQNQQSDYEKVRDFTIQAGQQCTDVPTAMNEEEVRFLLRMCLSELQELALTVTDNVEQSVEMLHDCMKTIDKSAHEKLNTEDEIIAAQADAVVDAWYYSCNAFAKKSVDVSQIFSTVHQANMDKRDPKTKKFIKREDGKIIKPKGWTAPDIVAEIAKQRELLNHALLEKNYHSAIDKAIPNDYGNETVKRISKLTISTIIKNNIELPEMHVDTNYKTDKCKCTFEWKDRLKYCIYPSGNCSVLDINKLELLENGFHVVNAEKIIIEWIEAYNNRKLSLMEASALIKDISVEDMSSSKK